MTWEQLIEEEQQAFEIQLDVLNSVWHYKVKLHNQINNSDSLPFLRTRFK